MTGYVLDTSAIMSYLLNEQYTDHMEVFFNKLVPEDRIVVPEFCLIECTNVIWQQMHRHNMTGETAHDLLKALNALPLQTVEVKSLLNDALATGAIHKLAVYDSLYLVLAKQLDYRLLTVDIRQERAAHADGINVLSVSELKPPSSA